MSELERARELYAERAWEEAYDSLARIERAAPLAPEDLELFATVAYMLGRDDEQLTALERAHQGYLDHGDRPRAVRCAFWLGVHLLLRRETARPAWDGSGGPSGCSIKSAATASSRAICSSRQTFSTGSPATWRLPSPPPLPQPRSPSASAMRISSPSPWRSKASC